MEKHRLDKTPDERRQHLLYIGKDTTWPAAGRIFCETQQLWCASVDLKTGKCTAEICNINDPAYIQAQKEIEKNQEEAHTKAMVLKQKRASEPAPKIRRQTTTKIEIIDRRIEQLEDLITMYYKYAKPHKAVQLELEVKKLRHEKRLLEQPLIKTNYR